MTIDPTLAEMVREFPHLMVSDEEIAQQQMVREIAQQQAAAEYAVIEGKREDAQLRSAALQFALSAVCADRAEDIVGTARSFYNFMRGDG